MTFLLFLRVYSQLKLQVYKRHANTIIRRNFCHKVSITFGINYLSMLAVLKILTSLNNSWGVRGGNDGTFSAQNPSNIKFVQKGTILLNIPLVLLLNIVNIYILNCLSSQILLENHIKANISDGHSGTIFSSFRNGHSLGYSSVQTMIFVFFSLPIQSNACHTTFTWHINYLKQLMGRARRQ